MELFSKIGEILQLAYKWAAPKYLLIAAFLAAAFLIWLFFRIRKSILVSAWVTRSNEFSPEVGKSLADLLLYKIRAIQSIHEKSIRKAGLWNPYYDIPAIQQPLDDEIKLLASIELGNYGGAVSKLVTFLLKLVPLVFQPAELKGGIHSYGKDVIFQVVLENYRPAGSNRKTTRVWEVKGDVYDPAQFPDLLDELAYQIYLELVGNDLIKSWKCFRAFALGLGHYISYIDIPNDYDFNAAEKYYKEAIEEEPNNPASSYNLGVLKYFRYQHEENEQAIEFFIQSLRSSDRILKGHAHSGLANALCQRYSRFKAGGIESLKEAKFHAEQAIHVSPKMDVANKALAFSYHQYSETDALPAKEKERNRKLAIKYYKEAFRRNPKHYIAYNNLGNLYLEWAVKTLTGREREKALKEAISYCEKAVEVQPSYHHAYDNIGNAYLAMDQLDKAEENYRVALIYAPDYSEAKNDLAKLFLMKDRSLANLSEALRLHNESTHGINPERQAKLCRQFKEQLDRIRNDKSNALAAIKPGELQLNCACLQID